MSKKKLMTGKKREPHHVKIQPQVVTRIKLRASEQVKEKRLNTPDLFVLNDVLFLSDNAKKLVPWLDLSCPKPPGSQAVGASNRSAKGRGSKCESEVE